MKLSVIIPTWNETGQIAERVRSFFEFGDERLLEVIVVDGASADDTLEEAAKAGARAVVSPHKGRAAQMNYGATLAGGDVLYFVHADTRIHPDYLNDIEQSLREGFPMGCYRYEFDRPDLFLRFNAWCTRFDRIWCRGGDQTFYIPKALFEALGGYRADYRIMEEYEFLIRARKKYPFRIIPKNVIVSARKYDTNSYLRVQVANFVVFMLFFAGASQNRMVNTYRRMLRYR